MTNPVPNDLRGADGFSYNKGYLAPYTFTVGAFHLVESVNMSITDDQKEAAEEQILELSKRIDFYLTEYSVELLAKKMKDGEFVIPDYQRDDTWEEPRKSRFIESLLMGLPIPFLFFWERPDGKLEIVDGSQRLRTIQQFVDGQLTLGPLKELNKLERMCFVDLPESRQRKINNRSIRGIVLNEHADAQARFDLFDRINTGSKVANKAEVRRGAYTGPFLDLVIKLSKDELFQKLAPVPEKSVKLREREELVTRFLAYTDGLEGYHDRVSEFLDNYAMLMNKKFSVDELLADEYGRRFEETMEFVQKVFPNGFRKSKSNTTTPRTRFESIALGSYFALQRKPSLSDNLPSVSGWINSEEFKEITSSGGSNVKSTIVNRVNYVCEKFTGELAWT